MDSDNRLGAAIALVLIVVVAIPILLWRHSEEHRLRLREARVVIATDSDPVFREGARHLAPDEGVQLAVALLIEKPGEEPFWLAPGARLVLDGHTVSHRQSDSWPEDDRFVRAFWFTVESTFIGGELTADNADDRLRYRTFLAPELGTGLLTSGGFEAHNDDPLGNASTEGLSAGTLRFHARVELVAAPTDATVLQAASTAGVDRLHASSFPAIHRRVAFPSGVNAAAGELFLLPGFEPRGSPREAWNEVTEVHFARPFTTLVEQRLVCSSRTFAGLAASSSLLLEESTLQDLGRVLMADDRLTRHGRPLLWTRDVRPGDILVSGEHWMVVVGDEGNGTLDLDDRVAHCWRRPAQIEGLGAAVGATTTTLELYRDGGGPESS